MGRTLGDFRLRKKRHPTLLCTWPAILCDTIGTSLGSNKLQPPPPKKRSKIKPMINQDFPNLPHPPPHHHQTWKQGARLGERNSISGSPMQILPSQLGVPTVSRPLSRHGNSSPVMEARAAWPQNGPSHAAKRRLMTTVHCSLI